jgi:hypothetical protein
LFTFGSFLAGKIVRKKFKQRRHIEGADLGQIPEKSSVTYFFNMLHYFFLEFAPKKKQQKFKNFKLDFKAVLDLFQLRWSSIKFADFV